MASLNSLLTGGKHGPALEPGDSKHSLIMQYVSGERTPKMPVGGAFAETSPRWPKTSTTCRPRRSRQDTGFLSRLAPTQTCRSGRSAVRDTAWVKNPIDAFILAKLEAKA